MVMNKGKGKGPGRRFDQDDKFREEFDQKILELARVTRVTAGGKRMRFRALIVVGDRKGRVGYGLAKGLDVQAAVQKSFTKAKKSVFQIPLVDETIPHVVQMKDGSAEVLIKPAPRGTGIKAGGPLRVVLELGGVPNVIGKMLGSANKLNNVRATLDALHLLERHVKDAELRSKARAELQAKKSAEPKTAAAPAPKSAKVASKE